MRRIIGKLHPGNYAIVSWTVIFHVRPFHRVIRQQLCPPETRVAVIRTVVQRGFNTADVGRLPVLVIVYIQLQSQPHLAQMVLASRGMGLALALGERRQEERGQNGDNGNHDEQFHQSECSCG